MLNLASQLPFYNISDADFASSVSNDCKLPLNILNSMTVEPFAQTCDGISRDYDPDNFYTNSLGYHNPLCNYIFPDNFPSILTKRSCEHFNFFFCNINSIPSKLKDLINDNILPQGFDAIAFCETKLTSSIEHLYEINGYNMYTNNNSRSSGGIAMYLKEDLDCFLRDDLTIKENFIETLFIEIKTKQKNIIVGAIYRRPKTDITSFNDKIDDILQKICSENKIMIISGDFNFDLLKLNSVETVQDYVTNFLTKQFFHTITKPTRVTSTAATLIDHIWCNNLVDLISSGIIYSPISDHFPIISSFKINHPKKEKNTSRNVRRKFNDENIAQFIEQLKDTSWDLVFCSRDPNVILQNFYTIFNGLFDQYFPLEVVKHNNDIESKPYITYEIKQLIKEKHKLQKKFAKYPLSYGDQYRQIRNRVTQTLRTAETNYYKTVLNKNQGKSK